MAPTSQCLSGARLPSGLLDLDPAPGSLYLTGVIPPGPRVAVVGTRHPSREAEAFAYEFSRRLADAGVVVVSGGAQGIDAAAHGGALSVASGAGTLVVAPCGWDHPFPSEHAQLFRRIVSEGGGYLSAHRTDVSARRHAFFLRNGILAAISLAVVLIEAPLRSGARNAAKWARRLQRPLWVVPHAPWMSRGAGCNADLKLGGKPCTSVKDVLDWVRSQPATLLATRAPGPSGDDFASFAALVQPSVPALEVAGPGQLELGLAATTGEHWPRGTISPQRLRNVLAAGPLHREELCRVLAVQAAELQRTLTELELEGWVETNPGGWVRASNPPQPGSRGLGSSADFALDEAGDGG